MATKGEHWYFTKQQLENNSPSRKDGIDYQKELNYRQQAAMLIQDMGQRLKLSQLTINTGIVYLHRFYALHSMRDVHRNDLALAAIFLAAKIEEQPRPLEHCVRVYHGIMHRQDLDANSATFKTLAASLVQNEHDLLQTLGFDVSIDHPHSHVVRCTQMIKASKELAQTSYFMATNSLHLTTYCLQYKPPVVACVCIFLACKWSSYEIPISSDGKEWFQYVDSQVTESKLEELVQEFLLILDKSPSRIKKKLSSQSKGAAGNLEAPPPITIGGQRIAHAQASSAPVKIESVKRSSAPSSDIPSAKRACSSGAASSSAAAISTSAQATSAASTTHSSKSRMPAATAASSASLSSNTSSSGGSHPAAGSSHSSHRASAGHSSSNSSFGQALANHSAHTHASRSNGQASSSSSRSAHSHLSHSNQTQGSSHPAQPRPASSANAKPPHRSSVASQSSQSSASSHPGASSAAPSQSSRHSTKPAAPKPVASAAAPSAASASAAAPSATSASTATPSVASASAAASSATSASAAASSATSASAAAPSAASASSQVNGDKAVNAGTLLPPKFANIDVSTLSPEEMSKVSAAVAGEIGKIRQQINQQGRSDRRSSLSSSQC